MLAWHSKYPEPVVNVPDISSFFIVTPLGCWNTTLYTEKYRRQSAQQGNVPHPTGKYLLAL